MRTIYRNWLNLSVALAATFVLTSFVSAEDQLEGAVENSTVHSTAKVDTTPKMSATQKLAEKRRLNAVAKTQTPVKGFDSVELFSAIDQGDIEVSLRQKDATSANIIVTNKSDKPLAIQMPATFSAVPVLRQFGGGGGGGGQQGGQQGGQGGQQQGTGGGVGGGGGGGQFGGGGGGQQGGGGVFNIPPGRVGRVAVKTFCLEEGKPDPRSSVEYKIQPLSEMTTDPRIAEMCRMLANDEISQPVAQAAAWTVTDGLSWQELLVKNKVERMDGSYERFFNPQHIYYAQKVITETQRRAEAREKWLKEQSANEEEKYSGGR